METPIREYMMESKNPYPQQTYGNGNSCTCDDVPPRYPGPIKAGLFVINATQMVATGHDAARKMLEHV